MFDRWGDFREAEIYGVRCRGSLGGGVASICNSCGWVRWAACSDSDEALITIVRENSRRRRLGEKQAKEEQDDEDEQVFEKHVVIDGEDWTVVSFSDDFEE